jgi:hypothetical protein
MEGGGWRERGRREGERKFLKIEEEKDEEEEEEVPNRCRAESGEGG